MKQRWTLWYQSGFTDTIKAGFCWFSSCVICVCVFWFDFTMWFWDEGGEIKMQIASFLHRGLSLILNIWVFSHCRMPPLHWFFYFKLPRSTFYISAMNVEVSLCNCFLSGSSFSVHVSCYGTLLYGPKLSKNTPSCWSKDHKGNGRRSDI